jgi:peptidoglycan/xylan/chitin deacetylase (PgdA/CDA1 family)
MRRSRWLSTAAAGALLLGLAGSAAGAAAPSRAAGRGYTISRCGAPRGTTYLTYDDADYSHPGAVLTLAKAARREHVGLGVFHVASVVRSYLRATGVDIPERLRKLGMYVNNHTYDHADLTGLSDGRIDWEIQHGVHGAWLRPPYGAYNSRVRSRAHALGYRLCTWTFDTGDWKGYSASSICANVVHNAAKGAVVLMHLNHSAANPHALRCIVHGLRSRGHHLCRPYTATHAGAATPIRLRALPC